VTYPTVQAPAYSVVDLNASVRSPHVAVRMYVTNLANRRAILGSSSTDFGAFLPNVGTGANKIFTSILQPRTIGVALDYTY
jgi:outer membrane receptor protein involved in Fe transport